MLIADENVSENEIWRLRKAGFSLRVIGDDLAIKSISDENILPVLLKLKKPTLLTRDRHFWKPSLCQDAYCLAFFDVPEHEGFVAERAIQFLRHHAFNTAAKRLGRYFESRQR